MRARPAAILAGLLSVAVVATLTAMEWRRLHAAPQPVVPEQLGVLPTELRSLIARQVEAVRASPRDAAAHATLGLVYEANQLWAEARRSYQNASVLDPDQPMWVYHAAIAAQMAGDVAGAVTLLRPASDRFPRFAPIAYRLGDLLLDTGALDEAVLAFKRAIDAAPSRSEAWVALADVKLRRGRYAEAAKLLERAVQTDPSYGTAHYLLGTAYRALGHAHEAEQQLRLGGHSQRRYLEDSWSKQVPQYARTVSARLERSKKLIDASRWDEAVGILEPLWASRPDDVRVMSKLGIAYSRSGRLQEAKRVLLRAKRVDDRDLSVAVNLAGCCLAMNQVGDALREADRAIALAPDAWQAHHLRGLALTRLGRAEAAYASFTRAIQLNPRSPLVYQAAAELCVTLQRLGEAKKYYQTVVDRWPGYVPAYIGLADVSLSLGQREEASAVLLAARTLAPHDPAVASLERRLREK